MPGLTSGIYHIQGSCSLARCVATLGLPTIAKLIFDTAQWTDYDDTAYSVAVLFTKYSILWLIKRIFLRVRYDLFYWIIMSLIVSNTIYYTILFFLPIWACIPRAKIWHPSLPGHCINFTALLMSSAAWNLFSDIAMLLVPIWMICRLQVSWKRKVASSIVFAIGGLYVHRPRKTVCCVSISTDDHWQCLRCKYHPHPLSHNTHQPA